MTEIIEMRYGHRYWDKTIALAKSCSWKAGPFLASIMENNRMREWERVFIALVDGKVAGFCTLAEKDELPDEYTFTPFVGFVFVDESCRGIRLSERMIEAACGYARQLGYENVYIMSGEKGLYEKYGFTRLGEYKTVYGTFDQLFVKSLIVS